MAFGKKNRTKAEWAMSERANKLRMVFAKDYLQEIYTVYNKHRSLTTFRDELIVTRDMKKADLFFKAHEKKRKGSYQEVDGDLIKMAKNGELNVIGHGCNCFATMGAGIAPQVKKAFPQAYQVDQKSNLSAFDRLGSFTVAEALDDSDDGVLVFNLYSQYMPGRDLQIEALTLALRKMAWYLVDTYGLEGKEYSIGLPLIGCGIAGGDWKEVSKIIKKELAEFDVVIVKWDSDYSKVR